MTKRSEVIVFFRYRITLQLEGINKKGSVMLPCLKVQ
jgi:hypothetical protein